MNIVYLDWAATAIPDKEILMEACRMELKYFANPSSIHSLGMEASGLLREDRETLSRLIGCSENQIIFTSGGTESNNTVFRGFLQKKIKPGILISGIEHASVFEPASVMKQAGCEVKIVKADDKGFVHPEKIAGALNDKTVLVSVMHVNNETGAVQPVREIAEAVRNFSRAHGRAIHIHSDCVQSFGKIPFSIPDLMVDSASFSAHKLSGPKGIGALYCKKESIPPLLTGGFQEGNKRAGTEAAGLIHGFVRAAEKRISQMDSELSNAEFIKTMLLEGLSRISGSVLCGEDAGNYSPYITMVSFPPIPGEVLVRVLSDRGFAVSAGSACSAKNLKQSRVLKNMGLSPKIASSSIRISTGYTTKPEDIIYFLQILSEETRKL